MIDQDLIDHIQEHDYKVEPDVVKELLHNYIKVIEGNAELYKKLTRSVAGKFIK